MEWIVLWKNNGRIGSVELTEENKTILHDMFYLSLIQVDASGTIHYEVLGIKKKSQYRKPQRRKSHASPLSSR